VSLVAEVDRRVLGVPFPSTSQIKEGGERVRWDSLGTLPSAEDAVLSTRVRIFVSDSELMI
jgi:hypothetical protein